MYRYLLVVVAGLLVGLFLVHFAVSVRAHVIAKSCESGVVQTLANYGQGKTTAIDAAVEAAVTGEPVKAACTK